MGMDRHVSRRTVAKLAYGVPAVAASLRISEAAASDPPRVPRCPPGQTPCDCLGGDLYGFAPSRGGSSNPLGYCGSCDPRIAGPSCDPAGYFVYESGTSRCWDTRTGYYAALDCVPVIRNNCAYCGPGDFLSHP